MGIDVRNINFNIPIVTVGNCEAIHQAFLMRNLRNYSGVYYFTTILSRFLQLIGKNSARIKLVFHFYRGYISAVINILPLWGYS